MLLIAGCGGDSGDDSGDEQGGDVAPEAWVETICSGLQAPVTDLAEALAVINDLPAEVDPDQPLGERLGDLKQAFAALPTYLDRYLELVETTPPPDIPDGAAFRDDLAAELRDAQSVLSDAADAIALLPQLTTATRFLRQVERFAGFNEALSVIGLDLGDDVPPEIADALSTEPACQDVTGQLAAALG